MGSAIGAKRAYSSPAVRTSRITRTISPLTELK